MERNFKLAPKDGVGIRVYYAGEYAFLRITEAALANGEPVFVLQRVSPGMKQNLFAVPVEIVENGGLCPGQEKDTVWEFPTADDYPEYTRLSRRGERKLKGLLNKFNPKRLFGRKRG